MINNVTSPIAVEIARTKDKRVHLGRTKKAVIYLSMVDASIVSAMSSADQQLSSNYAAGVDIWGNIPPKEPKTTVKCDICGRHVSALRFAPHLDKCMNLGNSRATGSRRS